MVLKDEVLFFKEKHNFLWGKWEKNLNLENTKYEYCRIAFVKIFYCDEM